MKATPLYSSFNGGEVSPELEGRVDIAKYHSSLYRCENMIPMIQGPARRRSGTRFVKEVCDSTKPPFLSKFIFNVKQSFVLEWGDHYVRFYTNHGAVLEPLKAITGATVISIVGTPQAYAGPGGVSSATVNSSTGVASGDVIFAYVSTRSAADVTVTTPAGWTIVAGPTSEATGQQSYLFQRISDGTDGATYTFNFSGPASISSRAMQITYRGVNNTTPVDGSVTNVQQATGTSLILPAVSPAGSADLLVAMFQDYSGNTGRAITGMTSEISTTTTVFIFDQQLSSSGTTGTRTATGLTSGVSTGFLFAVKPAATTVITAPAHGYSTGDEVFISGIAGMTRLNNRYFKITVLSANTFSLQDYGGSAIDSTGYAAYGSGGTAGRVYTIATPYAYADLTDADGLFTLRFSQIADVVRITNTLSTYPAQKLSRFGNTNWTLAPVVISGGPFKTLNPLDSPVMIASGQVGSVTVSVWISGVVASVSGDGGGPFITLLRPLDQIPPNGVAVADLTSDKNTTPTTAVAAGSTAQKLYLASTTTFKVGDTIVVETPPAVAVLKPGHVGALLYLESHDIHLVKPWEVGRNYNIGDLTRYNGVSYRCFDGGTAGSVPPTHLFGDAYDGAHKRSAGWTYQDAGYGWGVITAVAAGGGSCTVLVGDPTAISPAIQYPVEVTTIVKNYESDDLKGGVAPTPLWAIGAWNAVDGYPTHVFFFLNRLVLARFEDMQFSVSEDFENFAAKTPGGVVTDDMGISMTAPTQDAIQWLQKGSTIATALGVGTSGEELICGPITTSTPFSPNNRQIDPQGTQGSKAISALRIANAVLFVQTSGRELRKMIYEFYTNSFQSTNLTMLAREITAPGLIALDYQKKPDSVVWMIRGDGVLLGLTYDPPEVEDGQDVTAWHRHPLGATLAGGASVLSLTTLPAPDGTRDELWLLVQRTINGRSVTYIEYMEKAFDSGDAQSSACFMDSSMQYSGTPVTTVFPLDHLEGETVRVMVDGASHPDCVVTNGQITLNAPASVVQVGLKTAYDLVTLRVEAGSQTGTAQAKLKRITKLNGIRLLNSLGGWFGQYGGPWDEIQYRDTTDVMDSPPTLFTGDMTNLSYPGDWERNGRIEIKGEDQFPMCVVALFPELSTTD